MSEPIDIAAEVARSEIDRLRAALVEAANMTDHESDRTLIYNHCMQSAEGIDAMSGEYAARCVAAIEAMERYQFDITLHRGWWCVFQGCRSELEESGFYASIEVVFDNPLEAIEAAAEWLEKQETGT